MERSREDHREMAETALGSAEMEGGTVRTNELLKALTHAVLALSAPTTKELQKAQAEKEFFKELEDRPRRR